MKKIAITTLGSRGDLQPFIALALGLKQEGYDVVIISSKNEEEFVKSFDLKYIALSVDIQKIMEGDEVQEMTKSDNPIKYIISTVSGTKKHKQAMLKTQEEIWLACRDFDVIIFHPGMPIGYFIAKEYHKISILANPFPVITTKEYPSILFYNAPRFGKVFNKITHLIFEKMFWSLTKSSIKEFWKNNIKTKIDLSISPLRLQVQSGMPVINSYSECLFHKPKDWTANNHITGSWFVNDNKSWKPTVELVNFIENGKPPIFIGFGSMKDIASFKKTIEIILSALKTTNQRAIIGLGWNNLNADIVIPENIFLLDNVPFTWLFPKMSLVIHHGGAGTTAIGLASGKPTIIIPFFADQPAWGKRVYELKVGAKPIPKKKLTSQKLINAIEFALQPEIVANAKKLGEIMNKEKGVENAVNIINEFLINK